MTNLIQTLQNQPTDLQDQLANLLLADFYRKSLFHTAKYLLDYRDITWNTHGPMVRALELDTKRKLICVPRGCFKSSLGVVAYSIWLLLKNPDLRILIDSEVYTNSKNFLREIRAHLENPKLTDLFGPFKTDTNWTEGEITIRQRKKVSKEASITCGGVDTSKTGQHYNVIISDDLNSGNNSATPEGRQKVIQHYRMNIAILEPDGILVVIGTRYAADDAIGHILDHEINVKGLIHE